VERLPTVPARPFSKAAVVATALRRGTLLAAEGERAAPTAQVVMERTRRHRRPAVAAQAMRVLGVLVVLAVLFLGVPAGTAQNSKPHLRLGVGAAVVDHQPKPALMVGTEVITAGAGAGQ
jgi:hypothetical protein